MIGSVSHGEKEVCGGMDSSAIHELVSMVPFAGMFASTMPVSFVTDVWSEHQTMFPWSRVNYALDGEGWSLSFLHSLICQLQGALSEEASSVFPSPFVMSCHHVSLASVCQCDVKGDTSERRKNSPDMLKNLLSLSLSLSRWLIVVETNETVDDEPLDVEGRAGGLSSPSSIRT